VPLVVLPFSTDQFAGAAAIERSGFGVALAPNTATVQQLQDAVAEALAIGALPIAASLQLRPGAQRAYQSLAAL